MDMGALILSMLNASTAAHVLHFKTRSYSAHMALGDFYSGIEDIADTLAEAWQGRNALIQWKAATFSLMDDPEKLVANLANELRAARDGLDSELQNIIDEALGLCDKTLYKLRFLK